MIKLGSLLRGHRDQDSQASEAELERYNEAAIARYRAMAGMDLSREERAERARFISEKTPPLARKTW